MCLSNYPTLGDHLSALPVGGTPPGSCGGGSSVGGDWPVVLGGHGGPAVPHACAEHVWQTLLQVQVRHVGTSQNNEMLLSATEPVLITEAGASLDATPAALFFLVAKVGPAKLFKGRNLQQCLVSNTRSWYKLKEEEVCTIPGLQQAKKNL